VSNPKLHHYVPQFYLRRFTEDGHFWVFDKKTLRTFQADVRDVAAETHFYRIPEVAGTDADPLVFEKYFAEMEGAAATITNLWFKRLAKVALGEKVLIGRDERWWMSRYIALQHLRTAEQRRIAAVIAMDSGKYPKGISKDERANLHAQILAGDGPELCEQGVVRHVADQLYNSIWMFGRNATTTPFFTSDNPVVIRASNRKMNASKFGILGKGIHVTLPLSPLIALFCYERSFWQALKRFSNHLSPVVFTEELMEGENSGQMFVTSRFVFSPKRHDDFARRFMALHKQCGAGILVGRNWTNIKSEHYPNSALFQSPPLQGRQVRRDGSIR